MDAGKMSLGQKDLICRRPTYATHGGGDDGVSTWLIGSEWLDAGPASVHARHATHHTASKSNVMRHFFPGRLAALPGRRQSRVSCTLTAGTGAYNLLPNVHTTPEQRTG